MRKLIYFIWLLIPCLLTNPMLQAKGSYGSNAIVVEASNPHLRLVEKFSAGIPQVAALQTSVSELSDLYKLECCLGAAKSFTLSGSDLLSVAQLTYAHAYFELSTDDVNYYDTLELSQVNGQLENAPVTIYTRLKNGLSADLYTDELTISSYPATAVILSVSGEVGAIDGFRGNALQLDGSGDYVEADNFKGITGSQSRTYEAWIKVAPDCDAAAPIFANGINATGQNWIIRLHQGVLRVDINGAFSYDRTQIDDNEWHHIAVRFNNTANKIKNVNFIVDGKRNFFRFCPIPDAPINTAASQNLWIGKSHAAPKFKGEIDEVRVWDHARTDLEILSNMHLTMNGDEPGLEAYYQFNELPGQKPIDNIHQHDLSLFGDAIQTASMVDVAKGTFARIKVGATGNDTLEVAANGVEIDFANGGNGPNGWLNIYQLEGPPVNDPEDILDASRHWVIRNYGKVNANLDIASIAFTLPTTDTLFNYLPSTFSLHKRASNSWGTWNTVATSASTSNSSTGEVRFQDLTDFTSFSQLTLTSNATALPVTFTSFEARRQSYHQVSLEWMTSYEKDNAGFELQRSYDGLQFVNIGFVAGKGNSSASQYYRQIIAEIKPAYFRLKQIDHDGTFEYLPIRFVAGQTKIQDFTFFPNPSIGPFQVVSASPSSDEPLQFSLMSTEGRVLVELSGTLAEINAGILHKTDQLPSGIYLVTIGDSRRRHTHRLVINK